MIIDYRNNKEFALANGVTAENSIGETWYSGGRVVTGVTFKNFSHLCVEDTVFSNCTFEDCHDISFESCEISNCSFKNVSSVDGVRTSFYDSSFKECCSNNGPLLSIDTRGRIEGCSFETITALGDDGYVISSVYGKKQDVKEIKKCRFSDCKVESEDGELCYCAYFKPFSSFKTVKTDNVDYRTCHFDNCGSVRTESDQ